MLVVKELFGKLILFDSEHPNASRSLNCSIHHLLPLRYSIHTSDRVFLSELFPKGHAIFIDFNLSRYFRLASEFD